MPKSGRPSRRVNRLIPTEPTFGARAARRMGGVRIDAGISPFPTRVTARLPWNYVTGLSTPATTLVGNVTYRLNGPYDPVTAVGGTQPAGWDNFAAIYSTQRTVKARVVLEFSDPGATNYLCGYRVRPSTISGASAAVDYEHFMGQPRTMLKPLSTAGNRTRTYEFEVVPSDVYGQTPSQLMIESEYASTTSSTPSKEVLIDVCCLNAYGVAISATFTLRIEYEIIFTDPKAILDA